MAQRSHVPQFGNWESGDNVPYTVYFEKARKGRTGGKIVNPNDPEENPELAAEYASASEGGVRSEEQIGQGSVKQAYNGRRSREDGDARQFPASPARYDNTNRRVSGDSTPQRYGARGVSPSDAPKYVTRQGAGPEYNSLEKSPMHPHARISGKGSSVPSPAREGKISYDSSHGTPGRSRLRARGDESPDKGAVVPKFGDWSEDNPASADGFTQVFNKVREEKHTGSTGWAPGGSTESTSGNASRSNPRDSSKSCCCFPWK